MVQSWTRGFAGRTTPKRAHLVTTRARCYKIPQPSKPSSAREAGKRGGSVRMVAEGFWKTLGGGVEPLGDELVDDQENVLFLSKNVPALHSALHGSSRAPRDRGADSEPAANQLLKSSPACQKLSSQQVLSPALHRCSIGADQSLAAAPATPSLPTGKNFMFFKKNKCCQNTQKGNKTWSKLKTIFVPFKKYLHTSQKPSKSLFGRPPPFRKPYSTGMSKI